MQHSSFTFDSFEINLEQRLLTFHYIITKDEETIRLTEKLILPEIERRSLPSELLESVVSQLHLVLGISYWKLYCPSDIIILSTQLNQQQAQFWNTLYTRGLGEFYYHNSIDYRGLVSFPFSSAVPQSISLPTTNRSLVGVGGGKDSIVSIELLKKAQKEFSGYVISKQSSQLITETIKVAGIDALYVERIMDPKIAVLHKRAGVYNGHIPISSVYAFVGVLLAVLYDYSNIITSNEQSANYGNVEYLGEMINHQWSKSAEFERMFQEYIHTFVTPDITYFSLLRPWNEIRIAEAFSHYPQYFSTFSSCNRNFSSTKPNQDGKKWCGNCPKCAFVFALLAAFISREQLLRIFGENLLAKEDLVLLYKELLGMEGLKPFECVGTPEETTVAFSMAHDKQAYESDAVMKMYRNECLSSIKNIDILKKQVFANSDDLMIPDQFKEIIKFPS